LPRAVGELAGIGAHSGSNRRDLLLRMRQELVERRVLAREVGGVLYPLTWAESFRPLIESKAGASTVAVGADGGSDR